MEYREGIFVGYRYYDKKNMDVLFPFGHGLSYTSFEYNGLKADPVCPATGSIRLSFRLKTTVRVLQTE